MSVESPKIKAIVAMASNRVIGIDNSLPWHIPEDMARFKEHTSDKAVLMGRKTYESLPESFRPLPKRQNIVLSRSWSQDALPEGVLLVREFEQLFEDFRAGHSAVRGAELWVLGGQTVYEATLPFWDELQVTRVHQEYEGDAYFPEFESAFRRLAVEQRDGYSFEHYVRP